MTTGDEGSLAAADELYGLPLGRFTAERNERARSARTAGDRDLALRIGALAKPTTAAWLVNRLVRASPDDLQAVLTLAAETGDAQRRGDRTRLRALATRRRELFAGLETRADARAEEEGQHVGSAVLEEFEQTLQAALGDPDAAAAVASGRLVRALRADGLDPVDLVGAVAGGPAPAVPVRPGRPDVDPAREREARDRAAESRAAADAAEARASRAAERARAADAAVDGRARAVAELERRLEAVRAELDDARASLDDAQRSAEEARKDAEEAERVAARARAAAHDAIEP